MLDLMLELKEYAHVCVACAFQKDHWRVTVGKTLKVLKTDEVIDFLKAKLEYFKEDPTRSTKEEHYIYVPKPGNMKEFIKETEECQSGNGSPC